MTLVDHGTLRRAIFYGVLAYGMATGTLHAQAATCSVQNPCVQLPITNMNPLPSPTVMWYCMGSATSCSQTALDAARVGQSPTNLCPVIQSVWHCTQFSQSKTPQNYNDMQPYNSLMNYSFQGIGANGGVSATAPILIFQMPQAPAQPPSVVALPVTVTSGSTGIQP